MQQIAPPVGPRNPNGYTEEEILRELRAVEGTRRLSFRYELVDSNLTVLDDNLDIVLGGSIEQNFLAVVKRKASFKLKSDGTINYMTERIKPFIRLHMPPKKVPVPGTFPEPVAPELAALQDNFATSLKKSVWESYDVGTSNVDGCLRMSATAGTTNSAISYGVWDLLESSMSAELVTPPSLNGGTGVYTWMSVESTTSGTRLMVRYDASGSGALQFRSEVGNADADQVSVTYNPTTMRWVRIRENAGSVFYETSPDGLEWTPRRRIDTPAWVSSQAGSLKGRFSTVRSTGTASNAEWANLNLGPGRADTHFSPMETLWHNSFNGTPGVSGDYTLTVDNSGDSGNYLSNVTGAVSGSEDWSVDGRKSLKLGNDEGSTTGSVSFEVPNRETWVLRCWVNIPVGGYLNIFPQGLNPQTRYDIVIDDRLNSWLLGGVNIAQIGSKLHGNPFRLEVLVTETTTTYRLYWTDLNGTIPDFESTEDSTGRGPVSGFEFEGGGLSSDPTYVDNLRFGRYTPPSTETPESVNYVEWPQGVFILSSPTRMSDSSDTVTRDVTGYDRSQEFIDRKLTERYSVAAGVRHTDAINALLGDIPKKVTPSPSVLSKTREWPPGTTIENVINDLTQAVNYESLWFDEEGFAIIRPYILPDKRPAEFTYEDNELSVMYPEVTQEFDLFDRANQWVLVRNDPDQEPIKAVLTNNDPAHPLSTVRRGRVITDFREEMEASSVQALMKKAERLAWEASRVYEAIEFETAIMPFHSANDVYNLRYGPLAINDKYTEHSWSMNLEAGAPMSHRARRVVSLNLTADPSYKPVNLSVTGTLTAGNIAAGFQDVTPVANTPTRFTITFPPLSGNGQIRALASAHSSVPGTFVECSVKYQTPNSVTLCVYRTNGTTTKVSWFVMRNP